MSATASGRRRLVLLGAGLPAAGDTPAALLDLGEGSRVADWLMQATAGLVDATTFVAGYRLDDVREELPGFEYVVNDDWATTGSTASLLLAPFEPDTSLLVVYSDVLFRRELVEKVLGAAGDAVIAFDSDWRHRYHGRSEQDERRAEKVNVAGRAVTRLGAADVAPDEADAEFVGVVELRPAALHWIASMPAATRNRLRTSNLSGLLETMRLAGLEICGVDALGDWAELNSPEDLARFVLGTKAQTLERLRPIVRASRIPDQVTFQVREWSNARDAVLTRIADRFGDATLVVRSSTTAEDSFAASNAGVFQSLLDVDGGSTSAVAGAVDKVIASYGDDAADQQVLVQPMVSRTAACGVVFTRAIDTGAPYYVLSYDDTAGVTDSVTAGTGIPESIVVRKDRPDAAARLAPVMSGVLPAVQEIERLTGSQTLDLEFVVGDAGDVHLLQVRPLPAATRSPVVVGDAAFHELLDHLEGEVEAAAAPVPHLLGARSVFGVMPDWNPAEIIGRRPRPLALSLYQQLITDEVWAVQREEAGYRDVRPAPLLHVFAGQPYVDVRASLNSFIPATTDDATAERLVEFGLERLRRNPDLHDKVEFDVVPTCYALGFGRWRDLLRSDAGMAASDVDRLVDALRGVTRRSFATVGPSMDRIRQLGVLRTATVAAQLPPLREAQLLLADAVRLGTSPFAHLARCAFVAVTLLRSGEAAGAVAAGFADDYLASMRTVSHRLSADSRAVAAGRLGWDAFVGRYGHLRPGTYEITAPTYRADGERLLRSLVSSDAGADDQHEGAVRSWVDELEPLAAALTDDGLPIGAADLDAFLRQAVEGRELAKFEFTRNLSRALDALSVFGADVGLDGETLSHCRIEEILALSWDALSRATAAEVLTARAEAGRAWHRHGEGVELPALITRPDDITAFRLTVGRANFVGRTKIQARVVDLETGSQDLQGRIVCIPQADPGFDWLFSSGIAGLVTMYGGANSHMAIRAAEFEVPAAIGVGEAAFSTLRRAHVLELDPANQRVFVP